jgi:hypothetical protein
LLAASEVEPEEETIVQQVDPRLLAGLFIGVAILCLILFALIGPGRSILARRLVSLKNQAATETQALVPTAIASTRTPVTPSSTPTMVMTAYPTNTSVVQGFVSPTPLPPTDTPTPEPACRDALTVTLDDVGKTMCVQGVIIETIANPTNFMVIIDYSRGSFYWVTYDMAWSKAVLNTCYQITGKIDQIGISPLLVFGYNNMPEPCP